MRVRLDDWPTSTITVAHHHTYAQRPKPAPPDSFECWIEAGGVPVTPRLVFQSWSHSAAIVNLSSMWRHLFIDLDGKRELTDIVLRVAPRY